MTGSSSAVGILRRLSLWRSAATSISRLGISLPSRPYQFDGSARARRLTSFGFESVPSLGARDAFLISWSSLRTKSLRRGVPFPRLFRFAPFLAKYWLNLLAPLYIF